MGKRETPPNGSFHFFRCSFATAAYDFTERYLTELQGMSVAERKSKMERDNVQIRQGGFDLLNLINEQTSMNFSERENRYIVSLANESFLLIEFSSLRHANC